MVNFLVDRSSKKYLEINNKKIYIDQYLLLMNLSKLNRTKAETLIYLKKYEKKYNFFITELIYFNKKEYLQNKNKIFNKIKKKFKNKKIIIRSSSLQEDRANISNAGKYKSFKKVSK